jgi:general secretion pathway protein G
MNYRNRKGFTLIEVMVVAGIIAILAGVLVPMIFGQIDQSRISRAQADVKSIASSIQAFRKDTGKWPSYSDGTFPCTTANGGNGAVIKVLVTGGTSPQITPNLDGANKWPMTEIYLMSSLLRDEPANVTPPNKCYPVPINATSPGWKGPYMTENAGDPWGNAYLVNSSDFETTTDNVWVISAGPNGIIETGTADKTAAGDDIGIIIR